MRYEQVYNRVWCEFDSLHVWSGSLSSCSGHCCVFYTVLSHRFGSPAAAVADVGAPQVFDIDLIHHSWVLLLDL